MIMITNVLTEREIDVLKLAMDGLSAKESARVLNLSFRTIEVHRVHILKKTASKNLMHVIGKLYHERINGNI